jgi:hypothetical protein
MAVTAAPKIALGITETVTIDGAGEVSLKFTSFDFPTLTLNLASTPPVTMVSADSYALVAGAKTIDLTALAGSVGTVNATGLKLQGVQFKNRAGNNPITITAGASNGYLLFGTSGSIVLSAHASRDGYFALFNPEGLPDVGASTKNIDVAGTGTQTFDAIFLFG